jgi:MFS family permease
MPFLIQIPKNWIHTGIYTALSLRNFFAILVYPLLLILIKEAAPSSHLGKINGLAASAGGVARMMAAPISGYLYGVGSRVHFTPVAWWASALIAAVGAVQILFVDRMRDKVAHVRSVAAWTEIDEEQNPRKDEDVENIRSSR